MRRKAVRGILVSSETAARRKGLQNAPPMAELVTRYLDHRERQVAPNTLLRLKSSLSSALVYFAPTFPHLHRVNSGAVENYIQARRAQGLKEASVRNDLNALSSLFRFAIRRGWATENPVASVDRPSDREAVRRDVVSPEQEAAYFAACPDGDLRDMAKLVLATAARPGELLALTLQDVDLAGNRILIPKGKTASARRPLALTPEAREIIERRSTLIESRGPGQLFPYRSGPKALLVELNRQHRKVLAKIGATWPIYLLRHSALSRLAERNCPPSVMMAIAGHSSMRMLPRYIHIGEPAMAEWLTK